jgi:hypothetical protein
MAPTLFGSSRHLPSVPSKIAFFLSAVITVCVPKTRIVARAGDCTQRRKWSRSTDAATHANGSG